MPLFRTGLFSSLVLRFNRLPLWKSRQTVWGQRLIVPSADRLLYTTLHRAGLMGGADRRFYEAELRPGMTVLDIGANIGLYTLLFSRLVGPAGRVYAFEPAQELYSALERSCQMNQAVNVTTFPHGLSAESETRRLHRSAFNSGDNRVEAGVAQADESTSANTEISLRRGDDLLPETLLADFIKIDVQGWELHALKGLSGLIERSPRLQIYFEFWPQGLRAAGTEPEELFGFLAERDFKIFHLSKEGKWEPAEASNKIPGLLGKQQFVNLRAVKDPAAVGLAAL